MIACRAGIAAGGAENEPMDWIRKSAAKGRYFPPRGAIRLVTAQALRRPPRAIPHPRVRVNVNSAPKRMHARAATAVVRAPPIADLARLQAPNRRRASLGARAGLGSGRPIRRARDTRRGDHPEGDQGRVGGHHEGETPVGGPVTRAYPTQEYPNTSVHSSSATIINHPALDPPTH